MRKTQRVVPRRAVPGVLPRCCLLCCVLMITVRSQGATAKVATAEGAPWSQECRRALQSRVLLVRCGALLALRDRTLEHPGEVLEVYRQEPDDLLRRRMALVLGELTMRRELTKRATLCRPELAPLFASFEQELEAARDVTAAAWVAQGGPLQAVQTTERAQSSVAASAARLSQHATNLVTQLGPGRRERAREPIESQMKTDEPAAERELQLLRRTIAVALLDVVADRTPPFWEHLSGSERLQATQMLALMDGREEPPLGYPEGYLDDPNTPYLYALRALSSGRLWPWPGTGRDERDLALRPLAPLLRVIQHRADFHPGLVGLYTRETLAKWGDATALRGLSLRGIDDYDGRHALAAATIKARLGRIQGVDELWSLSSKTPHDALAVLGRILDVGVGPFPGWWDNLDPWLSAADREALKEWRAKPQQRNKSRLQDADWRTFDALVGKAREAYVRALRGAYRRERATLRYSPVMQRFYPPRRAAGNTATHWPPVHPGLADLVEDDAAARAWYAWCARRAFDPDLDVAVGATRALLWGEASAGRVLAHEARRLRHRQPAQSALLANLWCLIPAAVAPAQPPPPDPVFTLMLRFIDTNDASTTIELSQQIRQRLRPVLVPFLLVYAEQNPPLWHWLMVLKAHAARAFLRREVAREKTANELNGPKRGGYSTGYFKDLFRPLVFYHVTEALPALKRHTQNSWWPQVALPALGGLGGEEAVSFLRAHLEWQQLPAPTDDTVQTGKELIVIQLARNGDASRLEQCVEFLRSGHWEVPREAARSLRACLPFNGPDFDNEAYDPPSTAGAQRVHAAWSRWLTEHRDRLRWNPATRRYTLA